MIRRNTRGSAALWITLLAFLMGSAALFAQGKPKGTKPQPAVTNAPANGAGAGAKTPAGDATVLEVGRETFTIQQIADAYKRNANRGGKSFYDLSRDSAMEFLNLFANYRLKVQAALDAGIDKRPEVVEDLRTNRIQLAVPPPPNTGYLIERKVVDPAVERIFKRRDDEMLLSLIYVAMRPGEPADTLRAYKRALAILDKVRGGANFAEIAKDSSDDPTTKDMGGRLPSYITAGMILPPIEEAAYETKPGGIYPGLVRVPAGFVILKVVDRSPRYKIRAAHILIAAPANEADPNNSPSRRKADSVLKLIRGGADFAKLAREVSDDRVSAENGGDFMGYYTRSLGFEAKNAKLEPEIEAALYKLKDGEVSDVIKSDKYGYHILKRIDSRRPTFDEEKETIRQFYKQRLMTDDRAAYARGIEEKHGLKINETTLAQVLGAINQNATTADTAWSAGIGRGLRGETLFNYGGGAYTVESWIDSAKSRPDMRAVPLNQSGIRNAIYGMFEQAAMIDEAKNLETEYPEFATLMQEFRDGILIFNLEDEMIWKKLNSGYTDERGRAFYEKHREKYKTLPKLGLTEIFAYKEDEVKDLYSRARKGDEPFDTLAAHNTQRQDYRERAGHWGLSNQKNSDIVKQVLDRDPNPKVGEILPPFEYQGGWSIIRIDSVEASRPMTYDEAKPEVQGDFIDDLQKDLTREWLDTLRLKYRVKIDEKTLKNALAAK